MCNKFFIVLIIIGSFCSSFYSQKTLIYTNENIDYVKGIELFQKQKYASAQRFFTKVISNTSFYNTIIKAEAEYYAAICAIELFNKDGELLLKKFIEQHPESNKIKPAYFYLGKYNYRKKKYDEATKWFEKVEVYDLSNVDLAEYYFKKGHSYFEMNEYENAKPNLYEIKDVDTRYTAPANYYYSHIAYTQQHYETALQGFLSLSKNEYFGPIVPYYIAQLYYLQGKNDSVISYAIPLLDSSDTKRTHEIAKIIGEAYYKTSRFSEAIPYLKKYAKGMAGNISRSDNYQLGYAYYKKQLYDTAGIYFTQVTNDIDSLAQNAYYHLGDCYIKLNKKKAARNAFQFASKLNTDPVIKEDALFNFAKLSYELSFNPFNDAIKAFHEYLDLYPESIHTQEAYTYLVNAYLTTKNYKNALVTLEKIKDLSLELKSTYQKITYYLGVEYFNSNQLDSAIKYFDISLKNKVENAISSYSLYWKAEAFYRKNAYQQTISTLQDFFVEPGAYNLQEYTDAHYTNGYAHFQLKEYEKSTIWFRKFVSSKNLKYPKRTNDAYLRIGDGFFVQKDYLGAIQYYGEAVKMNLQDVDYAIYQRAICYGVEKKYDQKIEDLEELLKKYPKSFYAISSTFELATTYQNRNNSDKAAEYFTQIINNHPNSSYYPKSILQMGLIYYNQKQDEKAISFFDKTVKGSNDQEDKQQALNFIKKIYLSKNDVEGLEKYYTDASIKVETNSIDSISFDIAKQKYDEGNCKEAIVQLDKYIQKYPNGIFSIESKFYKAECEYKLGNYANAIYNYQNIIAKGKTQYLEESLLKASHIDYTNKNYLQALNKYSKLDSVTETSKNAIIAKSGKMKCFTKLANKKDASVVATELLLLEKVPSETLDEAHLAIASNALEMEQYEAAIQEYQTLSITTKNPAVKGEAMYNIAYIQYLKFDFKTTEAIIFELISSSSVTSDWMTKSLLLLSDNYLAQNDAFQAKHTLKTVIDNADNEEYKTLAKEKLNRIEEQEQAAIKKLAVEDLKIEYKENKIEYNNLFVEPEIKE